MKSRRCKCGCGGKIIVTTKDPRYQNPLYLRGHNRKNWKGGRVISSGPYPLVWAPTHPRANRGYVQEHLAVVEKAMGKHLEYPHVVHHVDGDKHNNANKNLVVCEDQAYHMLLEKRQRKLGIRPVGAYDYLDYLEEMEK